MRRETWQKVSHRSRGAPLNLELRTVSVDEMCDYGTAGRSLIRVIFEYHRPSPRKWIKYENAAVFRRPGVDLPNERLQARYSGVQCDVARRADAIAEIVIGGVERRAG
jgi:hypothetical protein